MIWFSFFSIFILNGFINSANAWDVARDIGAIISFLVGFWFFPRLLSGEESCSWQDRFVKIISILGIAISIITIFGALSAYSAGASAYIWRGEYIIFAHNWLLFCFIANLALYGSEPAPGKYVYRAILCLVATLSSLSRTDFVLIVVLLVFVSILKWRSVFGGARALFFICFTLFFGLITLPYFYDLDVVQERIVVSENYEDDSSLSWRLIENDAFLETMAAGGIFSQIIGFGLGARMPLPVGVLDFNGNDSIPHLHNSFLTIALKTGAVGVILLLLYLCKMFLYWYRSKEPTYRFYSLIGWGYVLVILAKATTLQALSDWSHLIFMGVACAFITEKPKPRRGLF